MNKEAKERLEVIRYAIGGLKHLLSVNEPLCPMCGCHEYFINDKIYYLPHYRFGVNGTPETSHCEASEYLMLTCKECGNTKTFDVGTLSNSARKRIKEGKMSKLELPHMKEVEKSNYMDSPTTSEQLMDLLNTVSNDYRTPDMES
ncbi:MAG: hypothetical protein K2K45_06300 [Muribaculaceae bacterium]|nr:hypothetical protein [Muribaculaceae bacterium]